MGDTKGGMLTLSIVKIFVERMPEVYIPNDSAPVHHDSGNNFSGSLPSISMNADTYITLPRDGMMIISVLVSRVFPTAADPSYLPIRSFVLDAISAIFDLLRTKNTLYFRQLVMETIEMLQGI